jgi:hypothetical protein
VTGGEYGVGGLVGDNMMGMGGAVEFSFWDTETSGMATSFGGTGLTTAEMQTESTFTGWDFVDVWYMLEGGSYPYLQIFDYL